MSEFTVKEFAKKEQVSTRTVRTWMEKGAVDFRRTPGGGIRIVEPSGGIRIVEPTKSNVVVLTMKSPEDRGNPSA